MKTAGLGNIRKIRSGEWQGTTGENPRSDLTASVFVHGPYASVAAATGAAAAARHHELAFSGGRYVATAITQSYLSATASFAAACLSGGVGGSYHY